MVVLCGVGMTVCEQGERQACKYVQNMVHDKDIVHRGLCVSVFAS